MKDPSLSGKLKKTLLENYFLIEELFTLKVFNKALFNLSLRGVELTHAEIYKYKVAETVGNFFSKSQLETFMSRIQTKLVGARHEGTSSSSHQPSLAMS